MENLNLKLELMNKQEGKDTFAAIDHTNMVLVVGLKSNELKDMPELIDTGLTSPKGYRILSVDNSVTVKISKITKRERKPLAF